MHTPYPKILNGGGISVLFFKSVVEKSELFTSDFMFKALASLKPAPIPQHRKLLLMSLKPF